MSELVLDVISAKGICTENFMHIGNVRIDILHGNESNSSSEIPFTNQNETYIGHSFRFNLSLDEVELRKSSHPLYVYISYSLPSGANDSPFSVDHQPIGFTNSRTLVSQATVDLRLAFLHHNEFLSVELVPCSSGGIIDTGYSGVIFLKMAIVGPASHLVHACEVKEGGLVSHEADEMRHNIELHQKYIEKLNYEQYSSVKAFYSQLRLRYPYLEDRSIKLMALDECGRHRMVCNFVGPVAPSREIAGPRFSARLVSLLPFHRSVELVGGNLSCWHSPYSTLLKLQGDLEDHAVLLCSLLLGWGLDAYVAYGSIHCATSEHHKTTGSDHKQHHYWVVTMDDISHLGSSPIEDVVAHHVTFWEPLTGQQFVVPVTDRAHHHTVRHADHQAAIHSAHHPFLSIYSLFRHDCYYINTQLSPLVSCDAAQGTPMASFDLANDALWAKLTNHQYYDQLKHPGACVPQSDGAHESTATSESVEPIMLVSRQEPPTDPLKYAVFGRHAALTEVGIERAIQQLVRSLRKEVGLVTEMSDALATILQPALLAYEFDRAVGCSFGNADFQLSIKRAVKKGECFKAYPTCFSHTHIPSIVTALSRTSAFREVVTCHAHLAAAKVYSLSSLSVARFTRHAVRVKVVQYTEHICAVWVIVAVCFINE